MKNRINKIVVLYYLLICSCSNSASLPDNINTRASFPDSGTFSPAGLKLITTFINKELGTMSTLYGNSLALQKAKVFNEELSGGELFTLVTWKQQPDLHWFGADIPGDLQSVEVVKTNSNGSIVEINYLRYEGKTQVLYSDSLYKKERIKFILDQRASVMP